MCRIINGSHNNNTLEMWNTWTLWTIFHHSNNIGTINKTVARGLKQLLVYAYIYLETATEPYTPQPPLIQASYDAAVSGQALSWRCGFTRLRSALCKTEIYHFVGREQGSSLF